LNCKDCHDPHVANAAEPVVNPDTGASLGTYATTNTGSYFDGAVHTFSYGSGELNSSDPSGTGPAEPDYIEFWLVCHDGQPPTGVTVPGTMLNIGYWFGSGDRSVDQHGIGDGSGGGKGILKAPFSGADSQPYSAINCSTCHESHGSTNIYNLRTQVSVEGIPMEIGSPSFWTDAKIEETTPGETSDKTTYTFPVNADGQQELFGWGAWCSFCHDVDHGSGDGLGCSSGHMHSGGNF